MQNIKRCPFCGDEAKLRTNYSEVRELYFIFVGCKTCGARSKAYRETQNPEDGSWDTDACRRAVIMWNHRYPEDAEGVNGYENMEPNDKTASTV